MGLNIYLPEWGDKICARLAEGESIRTICKSKDMPGRSTVYEWLRKYPEFQANYTRAKEDSADALLEDIFDIADEVSEDPQRSRLRIDVRKWAASKLKPKKYGDRIVHAGDGDAPLVQEIRLEIVDANPSPEEA